MRPYAAGCRASPKVAEVNNNWRQMGPWRTGKPTHSNKESPKKEAPARAPDRGLVWDETRIIELG